MNNFQHKHGTKETLIMLKQLWLDNVGQQAFKQAVWSLKRKLPQQYDRALLSFISQEETYVTLGKNMIKAAKIFKNLDSPHFMEKKIQAFQNYKKNAPQLNIQQSDIIIYNICCLYEKLKMNSKAIKYELNGIKITQYFNKIKARIYLNNQSQTNEQERLNDNTKQIIERHKKIINFKNNLHWFSKLQRCTIIQIYNIGLSEKKRKKYKIAKVLFQKIIQQTTNQSKILTFAKINLAECYYFDGLIHKAINILNELIKSQFFYIKPYLYQLKIKINVWTRSCEILQLGTVFGNELIKQIKKQISSNNCDKRKENYQLSSKCLLKNSKLLFVQQKSRELDQILKAKNKSSNFVQHKKVISSSERIFTIYKTKKGRTQKQIFLQKRQDTKMLFKKNIHLLSLQVTPKQSLQKQNKHNIPLKKTIKMSKFETLNAFTLNSLNKSNKSIPSSHRISEKSSSENGSNMDEENHEIENKWTIIKNSSDLNQIAQKYLQLGDIYQSQGDLDSALNMFKQALTKGRYEAYGRIGNILYFKGKSSAIQYFQKYLKNFDENDKEIELKLLHCYSKMPQYYKKASQILHQILKENPCNKEAHILYATVLMKQGYCQKAIAQCQQYKQKNYTCFENHHILGLLYKLTQNTKEAFENFINALRVNPSHTSSLVQLTELTEFAHFFSQLIEIYKKALPICSKNHEILQILRYLVSKKTICFQQIKPVLNFSQLVAYGDYFMEKQMVDEAEYAYQQAMLYTNNTLLKQKLGNLHYFKKNYAQAQQYYRQSQNRKPDFKIQVKLGHTLLKQNKFAEAQLIFQECVSKNNQNKSIYLNMIGQCQFGLKNYEKALKNFEESSSLGYNKKVNFSWQNLCRKKIMQEIRKKKYPNS